jgi:hypothetical protein
MSKSDPYDVGPVAGAAHLQPVFDPHFSINEIGGTRLRLIRNRTRQDACGSSRCRETASASRAKMCLASGRTVSRLAGAVLVGPAHAPAILLAERQTLNVAAVHQFTRATL